MVPYEKKGCVLPMLFDTIPIENYIFSLLHAEIGIGNKIISSFYKWITTYIEPLSVEEIEMTNTLIDFQIELIDNQKKLKEITQHNITSIADLTNEKKLIESALKEKDVNNRLFICGEYKMECINEINILVTSIKELKDVKNDKENIVTSNKQCIIFQKDLIQNTRRKVGNIMIV